MNNLYLGTLLAFGLGCNALSDQIDEAVVRSLAERQVPGASIAIIRNGTVSARTYGGLERSCFR